MKIGDLVLIRYKHNIWFKRARAQIKWDSVAWVIDKNYVVEVTSIGIQKVHIKKFRDEREYEVQMYRLKNITKEQIQLAQEFIIKRCDTHYNWMQSVLHKVLCLVKRPKLVPIRIKSVYTSAGLISESLNYQGWRFHGEKHPKNISPEDIVNSKNVFKIKKHEWDRRLI